MRRNSPHLLPQLKEPIRLEHSKHFSRLALILTVFAIYMVSSSDFAVLIKILLVLLLLILQLRLNLNPELSCAFQSLSFEALQWTLVDKKGVSHHFQKMSVLLDMGICFLLALSNGQKRKIWLVFYDQLSSEGYRHLRLMEKFQPKSEE